MIRKLIVLSIVAAMLSPEVGARPVSRVEAEKVARGFFQGRNGGNTKLKAQRLPQSIIGETKGEVEPFYVFNNDSQRGGFVIVAGDDAFASVIGYSDTGRFDLDGAPSGLTELMKIYSRYVASVSSSVAEAMLPAPGVPKMEPLLGDIKWGQDYPFNTLCPAYVTGGVTKKYYTGCVATAATQVMRYYKYPERGTGSKTHVVDGNPITVDFGGTSYDWANMPAVASDSPSTNEVTALSRLAADFGIAVEMNYMAGGSGAYTMMVPGALRDYFGYDKAVRMHSRGYYTTSEWMGMIKAELDEGHPVYYAASSEDGLGGHAFVCDGYDSNDYVHINWGWYGRSDGYFLINRLNPGELGEGGGSGAYNISQEILTGFIPAGTADVEDVMSLYGSSRFTCTDYGTDMTLMAFIENLDTRDFNGVVGAVLVKDGVVAGVLKEESLSIAGFKNGKSSASAVTLRNVPKSVTAVADGDYRLNFGFKVQGGDKWSVVRHPIGMPGYADVSVKDGRITVNDMHKPAPDVVLLEKIAVDGDLYVGGCGVFTLNIENRSDDVRLSKVAVKLTSVSDPDVQAVATSSVNVYDESRATLELLISLDGTLAAGEYEVTAYDPSYPDVLFDDTAVGRAVVTVNPESSGPVVRLTSPILWQGMGGVKEIKECETLAAVMEMRNYGSAGPLSVLLRLEDVNAPERNFVFIQQDKASCEKREKFIMSFSRAVPVSAGSYRLKAYYIDAEGHEVPVTGGDECVVSIVENPSLLLDVTSLDMPENLTIGESVACAVTVNPLQTYRGAFYMRVRQFTGTKGEIVFMKSGVQFVAGEPQTFRFNYRPAFAEGRYMLLVEANSGGNSLVGGIDKYYREFNVSSKSGIVDIVSDNNTPYVVFNGDELVVNGMDGIDEVSIYTLDGRRINTVASGRMDVSGLSRGVYIVKVAVDGNAKIVKVIK